MSTKYVPCRIMSLAPKAALKAAYLAIELNPANAPAKTTDPQRLAFYTQKYWGPKGVDLTVSFMESLSNSLRDRIMVHLNAWRTVGGANVTFRWVQSGGQVRISRDPRDGHYSYLGPDILQVPRNQKTMNLAVTDRTTDAELRRVVTHEGGHTLGFPHEHLRRELVELLDVNKTLRYFSSTQGWNEEEIRSNVLTPLEERSITGSTAADPVSIMTYPLPGSITKNGKPIPGGVDLSEVDKEFVSTRVYPLEVTQPPPEGPYVKVSVPKGTKVITEYYDL